MTGEQRRDALALCGRILETAARLQADLQQARRVIEALGHDPEKWEPVFGQDHAQLREKRRV